MLDQQISRRSFLKVTTVAGTGMLVGCSFQTLPNVSSSSAESRDLGLFIQISKDNNIKIINNSLINSKNITIQKFNMVL